MNRTRASASASSTGGLATGNGLGGRWYRAWREAKSCARSQANAVTTRKVGCWWTRGLFLSCLVAQVGNEDVLAEKSKLLVTA